MRIAPGRAESVSRQTVKKQNKNKQNKTHTHTHTNNQQQKTVLGFVSSSFVLSWGFLRRSEVAKHAALLTQILRWLGTGNAEIQVPSAADLMHASPTARKSASPPPPLCLHGQFDFIFTQSSSGTNQRVTCRENETLFGDVRARVSPWCNHLDWLGGACHESINYRSVPCCEW